jgi:hypothetical protein
VISDNKIVFKNSQTLEMKKTQKQLEEQSLVELLRSQHFQAPEIDRFKFISGKTIAQVLIAYAPTQVEQVVKYMFEAGYVNEYLTAFSKQNQLSQKVLVKMYLNQSPVLKSLNLQHRISPVLEAHPFIRSRTLQKAKDVPEQLKQILRRQLLHTVLKKDYENLFLQAVLVDDYQLAESVLSKCSFQPRHQQLLNYYESATGKAAAYRISDQFNTFSAESGAKYGKVREQGEYFGAKVVGERIVIANFFKDAVEAVGGKTEQQFYLGKNASKLDVDELTIQETSEKVLLVRTSQNVRTIVLPHRDRLLMQKINKKLFRFVSLSDFKPAQVFVEVVQNGEVVQSGYTDAIGLFSI